MSNRECQEIMINYQNKNKKSQHTFYAAVNEGNYLKPFVKEHK